MAVRNKHLKSNERTRNARPYSVCGKRLFIFLRNSSTNPNLSTSCVKSRQIGLCSEVKLNPLAILLTFALRYGKIKMPNKLNIYDELSVFLNTFVFVSNKIPIEFVKMQVLYVGRLLRNQYSFSYLVCLATTGTCVLVRWLRSAHFLF